MAAARSDGATPQQRDNRRFFWILAALVVAIALLLVAGTVLRWMADPYQIALPAGGHV